MKKYQSNVLNKLGRRELLEQLAEEASELSQAALKLIRAERLSVNPTPVKREEAYNNIEEEMNDIMLCYCLLRGIGFDDEEFPKIKRWSERLGIYD